jgi:UDPglucose 6-dehydrogenase
VASLYRSVACPVLVCDNATAEMVKYASNAFLATKISFINEIASLCEPMGVDVCQVARGMGMDHRIGPHLLEAGLGWGGSCLPKDTKALIAMAEDMRLTAPLLSGVMAVNSGLPRQATDRLKALLGRLAHRTVTVWGLTFKPGTDDLRESPSLALLELLVSEGCDVRAYDPMVSRRGPTPVSGVTYCDDPYEASRGADAIVLATAWKEFVSLDMSRVLEGMKGRVLFDGRNAFAGQNLSELGFLYLGIGRDGARHTVVAALDGYATNGKISETRLTAAASRAATS